MHWFLYLYLGAAGVVAVPGHFDTLEQCRTAGDRAVADWRSIHTHSAAFAWCVEGGDHDLEG